MEEEKAVPDNHNENSKQADRLFQTEQSGGDQDRVPDTLPRGEEKAPAGESSEEWRLFYDAVRRYVSEMDE